MIMLVTLSLCTLVLHMQRSIHKQEPLEKQSSAITVSQIVHIYPVYTSWCPQPLCRNRGLEPQPLHSRPLQLVLTGSCIPAAPLPEATIYIVNGQMRLC